MSGPGPWLGGEVGRPAPLGDADADPRVTPLRVEQRLPQVLRVTREQLGAHLMQQLVEFRGDRGGGARQREGIAVARAATVVHHRGGELRNTPVDTERVEADRAGGRQEHDGRPAAARPVHENTAAVDLLEPSDRRSAPSRSAVVRHATRLRP